MSKINFNVRSICRDLRCMLSSVCGVYLQDKITSSPNVHYFVLFLVTIWQANKNGSQLMIYTRNFRFGSPQIGYNSFNA